LLICSTTGTEGTRFLAHKDSFYSIEPMVFFETCRAAINRGPTTKLLFL